MPIRFDPAPLRFLGATTPLPPYRRLAHRDSSTWVDSGGASCVEVSEIVRLIGGILPQIVHSKYDPIDHFGARNPVGKVSITYRAWIDRTRSIV
jgi:hypothetical protein